MRNRKQRNRGARIFLLTVALVFIVFVPVNLARANVGILTAAGERAAIVSAAINMPDGGLGLLRDRFRSELYGEPQVPEQNDDTSPESQIEDHNPIPEPVPDEPETSSGQETNSVKPPKIAEKYAAPLLSENFAGRAGGTLIPYGAGFIKNETKYSAGDIDEILQDSFELDFSDPDSPQVLLFHTHATESFERYDSNVYDTRNTWRSTDNNNNMVAVGDAMREVLEQNGIGVIHDTTQHDYPSYNGSYERSAKTVKEYLAEYPSIKVVLDLHRDAMERDNQAIIKPITTIDGKKAAQIMIIAGCDDGTMNMPDWQKNLRFAAAFQDKLEQNYPDLTRPIYFCYRKYNMDLSDGSLLLEFGSNANTLDEAVYSATLAGQALAELIKESQGE